MNVSFDTVQVKVGRRAVEGRLAFIDGELCAVLTLLEPETDGQAGWLLEAGFGSLSHPTGRAFASLRDAEVWMVAALERRP